MCISLSQSVGLHMYAFSGTKSLWNECCVIGVVYGLVQKVIIIVTSTPVNPTGVYPHMPIADCRSPRNTKSLQHRPSPTMRRNVFHSTHGPRRSGKFVTPSSRASNVLSIFDLGGLPLGQRSPKGEMTYCPPRSAILQNFSPIAHTVFEICVTEIIQSLALIFDPLRSSKVKCDGANRKPVGPTTKCPGGPTSYLSPLSRYFESKF